MYRFTSNPPCRRVKPVPAYVPTFYPLPVVGEAIAPAPARRAARQSISLPQIEDVTPTEVIVAGFNRYFQRSGMAPSAIGRMLANDPALFSDLDRGRQIGARLRGRLVRFLAQEASHA